MEERTQQILLVVGLVVLAVIVANVSGPAYRVHDLTIGVEAAEATPTQVIAKLSRQINPAGVPVIAQILDVEALKAEAPVVYEGAKNGDYVLQYPNLIEIYDFEEDKIVKQFPVTNMDLSQPQGPVGGQIGGAQPGLPADFLSKLAVHTGRGGNPVVAQIMDVEMLKAEQPAIYEGAKNGQFVVQYSDLLVVYDYEADALVKSFPIQSMDINQ